MATTIHASPSINETAVVVVFRIRPGCESSRENGFCVMASSSKWIAKIRRMHGVDMPPVAVAAATVREVDMSQVLGKKAGSNGCRDDVTTTCIPILDSVHPSLGKEENNKVLTKKWYHSGSFFFYFYSNLKLISSRKNNDGRVRCVKSPAVFMANNAYQTFLIRFILRI